MKELEEIEERIQKRWDDITERIGHLIPDEVSMEIVHPDDLEEVSEEIDRDLSEVIGYHDPETGIIYFNLSEFSENSSYLGWMIKHAITHELGHFLTHNSWEDFLPEEEVDEQSIRCVQEMMAESAAAELSDAYLREVLADGGKVDPDEFRSIQSFARRKALERK